MTHLKRIVFWEPCTSPHKADLFSAIAAVAPDIQVVCCAERELPDELQAQGWSIKPNNSFQTILAPSQIEIDQLVREQADSTLHIFSGIRWVPSIVSALKAVKRQHAKFAIMSEPRAREGWTGMLRLLHSWLSESWFRRNAEFVLAQGRNGPAWFRAVGYPEDRIFPFAYFVEPPKQLASTNEKSTNINLPIQIGYAGRLIKMKGIFELVAALAKLGPSAQLKIAGTGPEEQALKQTCAELQLDVKFAGVQPMQEIGDFMRTLDVLVLASTAKDGWGVVISEALMCGTAVIATPYTGASIILNEPLFGRCVAAGSPVLIAEAVRDLHASAAYTAESRKKREALARSLLSAENGAKYLMQIIRYRMANGIRPVPFYKAQDSPR